MQISNIEVTPIANKGPFKGYGRIVLDGAVQINFTIMSGNPGLFVSFPSRKYSKNGAVNWQREVVILDKELYSSIQTEVIDRYNTELKKGENR